MVILANSGEGIPELLLLLVQWAQKMMIKRLTYSEKVQVCFLVSWRDSEKSCLMGGF